MTWASAPGSSRASKSSASGATAEQLGDDPVIERGDVLHCDVGITVARLNTDTQHMPTSCVTGKPTRPAGLRTALANANALQDIVMEEIRPGRTGNEILAAARSRMKARGIDGTIYSHPIGLHGHGAGPLDRTVGLPGRRARPRRRQGHSQHVVFDRAAGNDTGPRMGRAGACAWRRRKTRSSERTADSLGAAAPGPTVPGEVARLTCGAGRSVQRAKCDPVSNRARLQPPFTTQSDGVIRRSPRTGLSAADSPIDGHGQGRRLVVKVLDHHEALSVGCGGIR